MHHRRDVLRSILVVVALVLTAVTFAATASAGPVTSSLMVPVDGLVFAPGGGSESVLLSGHVHLVAQSVPPTPIIPGNPIHMFVNLADVTGIGLTSGLDYVAIGAVNLDFVPPSPIAPQFVIMPVAIPPSPIIPPNPIMPITFLITPGFDDTGHLSLDATSVTVPVCTSDSGC